MYKQSRALSKFEMIMSKALSNRFVRGQYGYFKCCEGFSKRDSKK